MDHHKATESFDAVRALAPAAAASTSSQTTITINSVTSNVNLTYNSLPGNFPNTYGNQVGVWQASSLQIPYGQTPVATQPIPTNFQQGDVSVGSSLTNLSYVVGYAVGPLLSTTGGAQAWGNVAALALIPQAGSGQPTTYFSASVTAVPLTMSMNVQYTVPTACTPATNGAWLGVWQGSPNIYTQAPTAYAAIPTNVQQAWVPVNNVPIVRGANYTIVLYMSGYSSTPSSLNQQTAAAVYTFQN